MFLKLCPGVNPSRASLVVLMMLCIAGCGGDEVSLFAVCGRASFNGQPIPNAELVLHPQSDGLGWMPVAVVGADGTFEVGTKLPGDGAPAGRYKVTVTWHPHATDEDLGRNFLPARYSKVSTSPIVIEVGPEFDNSLTLLLTD